MTDAEQELRAAIRTLKEKGFTYHGGQYWKPPLGERPASLDEERAYKDEYKAELSLQRSNQDDKLISFRLRFDTGRTITMTMQPYDFALMVTGMTDVSTQVTTRNVELRIMPKCPRILQQRLASAVPPLSSGVEGLSASYSKQDVIRQMTTEEKFIRGEDKAMHVAKPDRSTLCGVKRGSAIRQEQAVLSCGHCIHILAERYVEAFRKAHPEITDMWEPHRE